MATKKTKTFNPIDQIFRDDAEIAEEQAKDREELQKSVRKELEDAVSQVSSINSGSKLKLEEPKKIVESMEDPVGLYKYRHKVCEDLCEELDEVDESLTEAVRGKMLCMSTQASGAVPHAEGVVFLDNGAYDLEQRGISGSYVWVGYEHTRSRARNLELANSLYDVSHNVADWFAENNGGAIKVHIDDFMDSMDMYRIWVSAAVYESLTEAEERGPKDAVLYDHGWELERERITKERPVSTIIAGWKIPNGAIIKIVPAKETKTDESLTEAEDESGFGDDLEDDEAFNEIEVPELSDDTEHMDDEELEDESTSESLDGYEPWGGAVEVYNKIKEAGARDDLVAILDEFWPEGLTPSELNDILEFDGATILDQLGVE